MILLTPGFWPRTYWIECYWEDDYWQDYGAPEGGENLIVRSRVNLNIYGAKAKVSNTLTGKSKVKLTIDSRSTI